MSKNYPPFNKNFFVAPHIYEWLRRLMDWNNIDKGSYHCFVNLLTRSAWRMKYEKEYVSPIYPLSRVWLRETLKARNIKEVINNNLIETDDKYIIGTKDNPGKCKLYRVPIEIIKEFEQLIFAKGRHEVNAYTGIRAKRGRALPNNVKQPALTKNGKLITSDLVAQAIRILTKNKVTVNISKLEKYARRVQGVWVRHEQSGNMHKEEYKSFENKVFSRMNSAARLYIHLRQFQIDDDYAAYQQCYKPTYTGRVSELFSGLQSSHNAIKRQLLKGIDYTNVDIKSSQVSCLHYFLPEGEIKDRIEGKAEKFYDMARFFGIPKGLAKGALFGTLFNAGEINRGVDGVVEYGKRMKLEPKDVEDFLAGLEIFGEAAKIAIPILKAKKHKGSWINHAGVVMTSEKHIELAQKKVDEYMKKHEDETPFYLQHKLLDDAKDRVILAFYVQGLETAIIHNLTVMGEEQYRVISNQSDGLIIIGNTQKVFENFDAINFALGTEFRLDIKPI